MTTDTLPEGTRVEYRQFSKIGGYPTTIARGYVVDVQPHEHYPDEMTYTVRLDNGSEKWGYLNQVRALTPEELAEEEQDNNESI